MQNQYRIRKAEHNTTKRNKVIIEIPTSIILFGVEQLPTRNINTIDHTNELGVHLINVATKKKLRSSKKSLYVCILI